MSSLLYVALGGFLGSISRYFISIKTNKRKRGTWIANITGAIFLAVTVQLHLANVISDPLWTFWGIGFCGAYTTYSTFGNETLQLLLQKEYIQASTYVLSSLGVSILLVGVVYFMF